MVAGIRVSPRLPGMTDVKPVPRSRPLQRGPERAMLESMLDTYRATVVNKVAGLNDAQAFSAAVPPSTLTPATVVKHLTGTERVWFSIDFADLEGPGRGPMTTCTATFGSTPLTRCQRSWTTT